MALELEGETLGDKHREYNRLLREQLAIKESNEDVGLLDDNDVNNMLKIDIANHNKNMEYILKVLQSDDLFYVSKALARCSWLVTDHKYANIINPTYLHSELFPKMTTKAIIKLKKHIRHHIKDETRAEMFYLYEKDKSEAIKWLPCCSVPFIEQNIKNYDLFSYENPMKLRLFKRLCEKSINIFEIIMKQLHYYNRKSHLQIATFLLNTDIDKYLDVIETSENPYGYPNLNHKATQLIMKHSPNRVIDNIERYILMIHIPTFVKYLKVDEIKTFLYSQAKKDHNTSELSSLRTLFDFDNLKYFIKRLPKNEQFEFVQTSCMLTENENIEDSTKGSLALHMKKICNTYNENRYIWYQFAPFNLAFQEITKLISENISCNEKQILLSLLIKCGDRNLQHIHSILKYYMNKHNNEEPSKKMEFVAEILQELNIAKCDSETWALLNELFTSMEIYDASSDVCSIHALIVNWVIIYNALNEQKTPEVIIKNFVFDTMKSFRTGMNQAQQQKVFVYLFEHLCSQINNSIVDEKEFMQCVDIIKSILYLIKDWEKSLLDYPIILNKIKALVTLKKKNAWKGSLKSLYTVNKSWRKHMFEESLALCRNEEVCLNALKHGPQLLAQYGEEVEELKTDKTVLLRRLLSKLRVYWPKSLSQQWIDAYLSKIPGDSSQNAIVRGICIILPHKQLLDIIEKYKPDSPKIDWKQIDERVLNVQRSVAQNMHRSRPQPSPDAIIPYAVGDYLQSALPSLLAIFYNLKSSMHLHCISKLLNAPVSVQKHGIRLAFKKLDREQLKIIFLNCWKAAKNVSIRAIIFKYTFTLLQSEKDPTNAVSLWELLKLFIDNLSYAEDKDIYKNLSQVDAVPLNIQPLFLLKSYEFLQKLIKNVKEAEQSEYHVYCNRLAAHSRTVMETIDQNFVTTLIEEFIENYFLKSEDRSNNYFCSNSQDMIEVISAYVLCSKNKEEQIRKYEQILEPLIKRSFEKWATKCNGCYLVRQNFQDLLNRLSCDLKDYVIEKKLMIPYEIYSRIQTELQNFISIPENYLMLTKWNLTLALAKTLDQYSSTGEDRDEKIGNELGNICLEYLKKDIACYFPCIYILFSRCMDFLLDLMTKPAVFKFYKVILNDQDFIYGYLSIIEIGKQNNDDEYKEIWTQVLSHPSVEVKMHYYNQIEEKDI